MPKMRKLMEKLEQLMMAVTFAEANEHEKALEIMGVSPERKRGLSFDKIMSAVAFAEAGEHDVARECIGATVPDSGGLEAVSIPGVRVWCGSVALEPVPIPGIKVWYGTAAA
jgi:hypothetical protein